MSHNESYFRCSRIGSSSSGQRVQVLTRFKVDSIEPASNTRVIARGGGATFATGSGIAGIWDGFGGGSVLILRWVSGSETQIGSRVDVSASSAADTYMNLLLEVNGSGVSATVKLKFWAGDPGDEPGAWTIEGTLGTTLLDSGSAGLGHYEGTTTDTKHEFLSIGYGEDATRLGGSIGITGSGSAIAAGAGALSIAQEVMGAGSAIAAGGGMPLVTKNLSGFGSAAAAGMGAMDVSLTEISRISARIFMPRNLRID